MPKKILVVDDEPHFLLLVKSRLEGNGYQTVEATDGVEALRKAKEEKPDLILLDLMLPKMDGYKVCGFLKKDSRYAKIPIVLFSARAQAADIKMGEEVGADGYLTKPFEPDSLLEKIRKLLAPAA